MTLHIPEVLKPYKDKPVAILGFGLSGRGAMQLLDALEWPYRIYDEGAGVVSDLVFDQREADECGLVIYSPGFTQDHLWINAARRKKCLCINEMDFASLFWKGKIYAVTGTNGKTTLTDFLAKAFTIDGLKADTAGNIGYPFSQLALNEHDENHIAVVEVSSFQSESLQFFKPDAVLWTNFSEDHLDRYSNMQAYFDAKWNLVKASDNGLLVLGERVARATSQVFGHELPKENVFIPDPRDKAIIDAAKGTVFAELPQLENFALGYAFWKALGLKEESIVKAAQAYTLTAHRFAPVGEVNGVRFWNDSKATNFAATLAAANRFKKPILWIGGGKYKGGNIGRFALRLGGRLKRAFLIGESAESLVATFHAVGVNGDVHTSLPSAIEAAFAEAKQGDDIVLSPGFSSLDMFSSFEERGKIFEAEVLKLQESARSS